MAQAGADPVDIDQIDCPEPDVPPELAWLWRAWHRLSDGRQWLAGMSAALPLPIGFRDLVQWSRFHEYDDDMFHQLDVVCRELDGLYIRHMQAKAKA